MSDLTDLLLADPLEALVPGAVLAVLTGVEGPHYRRPGTIMAFLPDGRRIGQITSGCIEGDLAIHAAKAALDGRTRRLRYGEGSPFVDLRLPCGGGIDIALVPLADVAAVRQALALRAARRPARLLIDMRRAAATLTETGTAPDGCIVLPLRPPMRIEVAGTGIEAATFAALAHAADYPVRLLSPDEGTRHAAQARGVRAQPLGPLATDAWTAVVLFFHDHEIEPPIIAEALSGSAFYIGAQGSLRAHTARRAALAELGVPQDAMSRLRGPIGVIRSARDPKVLALSVLAEIVDEDTPTDQGVRPIPTER